MGVVIQSEDGTAHPLQRFSLADMTISSIRYGEDGTRGQDDRWRHGFKLVASIDIMDCRITVEQSICLRGPNNDFDPTKAVVALKCYPELSFSYEPLENGTNKVLSFHGCVWQDVHPKPDMAMHSMGGHHGNMPDPRSDQVFTSWFSEIDNWENLFSIPERTRLGVLSPIGSPTNTFYAGVFAYWFRQENPTPNAENATPEIAPQDMEVVMVRHHTDPRSVHKATYSWRASDSLLGSQRTGSIHLDRSRREGQYDNVHNHGWMGEAINPHSSLRQPLRMAPVCGQACVHLHTRWLFGSDIGNAIMNHDLSESANYRGWDDSPIGSFSKAVAEAPLVPANQRVRVAVTDPSRTQRATPHSVLAGTTTTHGVREPNPNLSLTNRGIWYLSLIHI